MWYRDPKPDPVNLKTHRCSTGFIFLQANVQSAAVPKQEFSLQRATTFVIVVMVI